MFVQFWFIEELAGEEWAYIDGEHMDESNFSGKVGSVCDVCDEQMQCNVCKFFGDQEVLQDDQEMPLWAVGHFYLTENWGTQTLFDLPGEDIVCFSQACDPFSVHHNSQPMWLLSQIV